VREDLKGKLPRMADFAIWGEAVARGMGYKENEWVNLYKKWIGQTVEETVDSNPVGRSLLKLVDELWGSKKAGTLKEESIEKMMEEVEESSNRKESKGVKCLCGGKPTWAGTPSQLLENLKGILILEGVEQDAEKEGFSKPPKD
jgi:hypothetical protein